MSWPYQTLATHLTNPLIGINQTLNADETPPHTLQAMARNYATRIQNTHPTGPYHLLDWSFGGVLAHQIAIELHHRGHTDTRLILLDSLPTLDTNTDPTITPRNNRQTLQTLLGHHHTTIPDDQLHHLTTNHQPQPQPQPQPQHHPLPTPPTPHLHRPHPAHRRRTHPTPQPPHLRKHPHQSRIPPPGLATTPHRPHHNPLNQLHTPPTPPPQPHPHLHQPPQKLPPVTHK
ncbi:thioesterase domain-containing protein [Mycobacterium pseudoshottsii]|uniref:thioesterase domain-containing protein n=1 Tax=Mycobacterium pseudoshottsii TaxID=265949 RepID=UPI001F30CF46|nr:MULTISPECIES: thioesterase domain-containing protein [Mycobacterium]